MLTGFEKITPNELSEEEQTIAREIALNIKVKCIGKENAVSNKRLRQAILKRDGVHIHSIKIRKMINFIRANNLVPCLCANNKGYFKAKDEEEWNNWKKSMQQRINEMQNTLDSAIYFNDGGETL